MVAVEPAVLGGQAAEFCPVVRSMKVYSPVVQLPVGGDLVHAPTGAVLLQFRRVGIEGVHERVADYEQPVFAWR